MRSCLSLAFRSSINSFLSEISLVRLVTICEACTNFSSGRLELKSPRRFLSLSNSQLMYLYAKSNLRSLAL